MLEGKTGLIFGVANKRSIAWAIAQALAREGMRLAFTYQGERLKEGVEALATTISGSVILPCDVTSDAEIDAVMARCGEEFGRLDCLVHSVAFAPREVNVQHGGGAQTGHASRAHRMYRAGERRSLPAGEGKEQDDGPVHGTV